MGSLARKRPVPATTLHGQAALGALVRDRRRAAGLSQRELAALASMCLGTLRDLEQGRTSRPRGGVPARLAQVLGLEMTDTVRQAATDRVRPGGLWLQILGPLTVWRDGIRIEIGEQKQQTVLALLALDPDVTVARDRLVDALWVDDPPATATNLVQTYISRLRRSLDPGRSARDPAGSLVSTGTGYRLQMGAGRLDLLAFQARLTTARAARVTCHWAEACDAYEEALALFRGRPLAGLPALREHPAVIDLNRRRGGAVSEYHHVAARSGRCEQVLPHLQRVAADEPFDEGIHAQLMEALAVTGRRAAALRVFDRMRARLDEQLGIRPGPALHASRARILGQPGRSGRLTIRRQLSPRARPLPSGDQASTQ